jgi:hypothetical protein
MFGYDELEDDVYTRLAPLMGEAPAPGQPTPVLVEILANTDSTVRGGIATRVTIFAQGANYTPNSGMGMVQQDGDVRLIIEIEGKKRRGAGAVRELAGAVTALLLGYRFPNFQKLELQEDNTQKLEDGAWFHQIIFRARRMVVEVPDEVSAPLLRQVTLKVDTSEGNLLVGELDEE